MKFLTGLALLMGSLAGRGSLQVAEHTLTPAKIVSLHKRWLDEEIPSILHVPSMLKTIVIIAASVGALVSAWMILGQGNSEAFRPQEALTTTCVSATCIPENLPTQPSHYGSSDFFTMMSRSSR